jgi:rfaE bifunctional protein nucleotidyltransferase chain/domain
VTGYLDVESRITDSWSIYPLAGTNHAGPASFEQKICPPAQLAQQVSKLSRPLVFTNGVFDILHRGHVTCLAQARALGASLVLALNSDASARGLGKGQDRPVNPLEDRLAVAAALEAVTLVTWFEEDTPLELIRLVKPDVLVKGGDWKEDAIVGAAEVRSWGGSVRSIPFVYQRSTTDVIARIRGRKT